VGEDERVVAGDEGEKGRKGEGVKRRRGEHFPFSN
jgi:hypothetical protein